MISASIVPSQHTAENDYTFSQLFTDHLQSEKFVLQFSSHVKHVLEMNSMSRTKEINWEIHQLNCFSLFILFSPHLWQEHSKLSFTPITQHHHCLTPINSLAITSSLAMQFLMNPILSSVDDVALIILTARILTLKCPVLPHSFHNYILERHSIQNRV